MIINMYDSGYIDVTQINCDWGISLDFVMFIQSHDIKGNRRIKIVILQQV